MGKTWREPQTELYEYDAILDDIMIDDRQWSIIALALNQKKRKNTQTLEKNISAQTGASENIKKKTKNKKRKLSELYILNKL